MCTVSLILSSIPGLRVQGGAAAAHAGAHARGETLQVFAVLQGVRE